MPLMSSESMEHASHRDGNDGELEMRGPWVASAYYKGGKGEGEGEVEPEGVRGRGKG